MARTSADIYVVPRGERLSASHWRGTVLDDGHPAGVGIVTEAIGREAFEARLDEIAAAGRWHDREQGWPHPWPDSRSTDFAYVMVVGQHEAGADDDLEAFRFGQRIRLPGDPELAFPDCGPLRPAPAPAPKRSRFPGRVAKTPIGTPVEGPPADFPAKEKDADKPSAE